MTIGAYDYKELRAKAFAPTATKEDRLNLLTWFESYDMGSWNGEFFDLDNGWRLYPVYAEDENGELVYDEYDNIILVDAEIR